MVPVSARKGFEFMVAAIIVVFAAAGFLRNDLWRDGAALYGDVSAKSPHLGRPLNNLGGALLGQGRYAEALDALERAAHNAPYYQEPHYNMGIVHVRTGEFGKAAAEFEEVLKINAVLARGHYGYRGVARYELGARKNLGNIYSTFGEFERAVLHYREALKSYPNDADLHFNLAVTLKKAGRTAEAIREFEETLSINPTDEAAKWNLSTLRGEKK